MLLGLEGGVDEPRETEDEDDMASVRFLVVRQVTTLKRTVKKLSRMWKEKAKPAT